MDKSIEVGSYVKLNPALSGDDFKFKQGSVRHDEIGTVVMCSHFSDDVSVKFPKRSPHWGGEQRELILVESLEQEEFLKKGDKVRLNPVLKEHDFIAGQAGVSHDEVGVITSRIGSYIDVDFPSRRYEWTGEPHELIKVVEPAEEEDEEPSVDIDVEDDDDEEENNGIVVTLKSGDTYVLDDFNDENEIHDLCKAVDTNSKTFVALSNDDGYMVTVIRISEIAYIGLNE